MARKTFNQAKEDMSKQVKGDYINSFYLKKEKDTNFIKLLETDIQKLEVHSVHNVPITSPNTGKTFYSTVDCLGDNCPLCTMGNKARDMIFVPIIQLYNFDKEFEPEYKILHRSLRWATDTLIGFANRYGLDGIIEVERTGEGLKTNYSLYEARKAYNGQDIPELPDVETLKKDFNVKSTDICGGSNSLIKSWTRDMCNNYLETGTPYNANT